MHAVNAAITKLSSTWAISPLLAPTYQYQYFHGNALPLCLLYSQYVPRFVPALDGHSSLPPLLLLGGERCLY